MKKKRTLFSLFLAFLLIFSLAGTSFALEQTETVVSEDGHIKITLRFTMLKKQNGK